MDRPDGQSPRCRVEELDPEEVALFLRHNPDFLFNRPELTANLKTPSRDLGKGVVDLQHYLLERLRSEVARLKLTQRKLIAISRNNLASQSRVHGAVLELLNAESFERLIAVVTDDLPLLLDIDAVGLCIETLDDGPTQLMGERSAVRILSAGTIDALLEEREVALRADVTGDRRLFAAGAGLVRSDALVRLHFGEESPPGLLALGARRPGIFHTGQGTELIGFLARVIEVSVRSWLDLPS